MMRDEIRAGSRVCVLGMARSGVAAARLLAGKGLVVHASDSAVTDSTTRAGESLEGIGVDVSIGRHPLDRLLESAFVVVSPGIPDDVPVMSVLMEKGIPVYSEIEIAGWYATSPIVAVTGTNGKTTTVEMIGHLTGVANIEARVCGNVGNPLSAVCEDMGESGWLIVEVSSFQLQRTSHFHPCCSVILNVTPDHLDRYTDFQAYAADKARIMLNMNKDDIVIYNAEDPVVTAMVDRFTGFSVPFSTHGHDDGIRLDGDRIRWRHGEKETTLFGRGDLSLNGEHNLQNAMVAAAVASHLGASYEQIRRGLGEFRGLPHRLEMVREVNGIQFVNDSKATNPGAVKVALKALGGGIILLVGGREKGLDYTCLKEDVEGSVKAIVAMGECSERIVDELGSGIPAHIAVNMRDAVSRAFEVAEAGETVLLSPGTSSYDMYEDYERRGFDFKEEVKRLGEST